VADLSGEVNYRNFAGTPGKNPKYLSDSLTPWYGTWTGIGGVGSPAVAYDNLPSDGTIVGRIWKNLTNSGTIALEFTNPQNINECELSFYIKAENADCQLYLMLSANPAATYTTQPYCYRLLYGAGASPTVWTSRTFILKRNGSGFTLPGGIIPEHEVIFQSCKSINIYRDAPAPNRIIELAGLNIRRL